MYSMRNFVDKAKRYASFSEKELKGFVLTVTILAFIFSFRQWGGASFDAGTGFRNFLQSIVLVGVALWVHEYAHKLAAISIGYRSEYKPWILGLVAGLIITFVTNGNLLFIAPGSILVSHLAVHRLGRYRYAMNYNTLGWIAMAGPIANIFLALICKAMMFTPFLSDVFGRLMWINIWIALFSMLPIPPFNGSKTFFGSRYVYVFVAAAMIAVAGMLTVVGSVAAFFIAILFGATILFVFFSWVDKMF